MISTKILKRLLTKKFLYKEYITKKFSCNQIANEIGCNGVSVWNYLKKLKIKTRDLKHAHIPKNNNNYIDGRSLKPNFCIDCGKKLVDYRAKKCGLCAHIKHGKYSQKITRKLYYCKDCLKRGVKKRINWQAALYGTGLCVKCSNTGKNNAMYGVHRFGKDNPNFKDGKHIYLYPNKFTQKIREFIRERDEHVCQICGKTIKKNGRKLDVHHIDYDKENLDLYNLISLCRSCHVQTNGNREIYIEYFEILLNVL